LNISDSVVNYSYASGNLLDSPNKYFYTEFQGQKFLESWQENRLMAIVVEMESVNPSQDISITDTISADINTQRLLLRLIKKEQDDRDYWISRLVKKFEVSKRLFSSYQKQPPHRPSEGANFHELDLYLLFAELLIEVEQETPKLQWENTLLKVMDTLVSLKNNMTEKQHGNLNWLLNMEQHIISIRYCD